MTPMCCRAWMIVPMIVSCDKYDVYTFSQPFTTMSIPCVCLQNMHVPKLNIFTRTHILITMLYICSHNVFSRVYKYNLITSLNHNQND
jgi:hypothetical protein